MTSNSSTSDGTSIKVSEKVSHFKQDVWSIFTPLAARLNAVNLGQGFMNFPPPDFVKEAAKDVLLYQDSNQYSHPKGRIRLRQALANTYGPLLNNRTLDPETEIVISAGANEGLYSIFAGFLDEGDESNITMNGGVPVYVPLRPQGDIINKVISSADWKLDFNELESKITKKSKMIVFNTPHNPVGKVFSIDEMMEIAKIAQKHNLLVISDEVYDRLYFKPDVHERIANLPGMWDRTITVGSGGKTFGVTGWRVGWSIGPEKLIKTVLSAHTRIVFCVNSPLQEALAISLEKADESNYYEENCEQYKLRREKLMNALSDAGLPYTIPQGSYFILANTSKINIPSDFEYPEVIQSRTKDYKVCYWMAKEIGVVTIPPSEFYCDENKWMAYDYARFAFCKTDETLDQAATALKKLKKYIKE
ncbi:3265_t:CDS:2 [Entrophospora sp. SA101]|nr:1647_t:CDS:2 [Entrophospora sp. SA101]CAJ0628418.1 4687_t:CDS:2 [Entrophospora sp. SA101]CAJ0752620.1 15858_t:CDS:2 [Entrophospora sp. SA101]CAJ0753839.1 3265_t:CDS:2 [Entrophospora sp. SA101]CAJ0832203.1 3629_t:CDS:2 [Entrophospora sp. SA101]